MRKITHSKFLIIQIVILCLYVSLAASEISSNGRSRTAMENEFPAHASLASTRPLFRVFCSGAIITGILVLTTANCLTKYPQKNTAVFIGSNQALQGEKFNVANWMSYSEWARENNEHHDPEPTDIGIVQISRRINFTPRVNLALMPLDYEVPIYNMEVTVLSWPEATGYKKMDLIAGNVSVTTFEDCKNKVHGPTRLSVMSQKLFCSVPGPYLTKIDEGGPVFFDRRVLVGINYWRQTRTSYPKVNMHINFLQFREFIKSITDMGQLKPNQNLSD